MTIPNGVLVEISSKVHQILSFGIEVLRLPNSSVDLVPVLFRQEFLVGANPMVM